MIHDESLERLLAQRREQTQRRHAGRTPRSPQEQST
jgi:hypothetical protein